MELHYGAASLPKPFVLLCLMLEPAHGSLNSKRLAMALFRSQQLLFLSAASEAQTDSPCSPAVPQRGHPSPPKADGATLNTLTDEGLPSCTNLHEPSPTDIVHAHHVSQIWHCFLSLLALDHSTPKPSTCPTLVQSTLSQPSCSLRSVQCSAAQSCACMPIGNG